MLLLASFMFQQPSKINTGGTWFVYSHAVKVHAVPNRGEAYGLVPKLLLGRMKLCLSVGEGWGHNQGPRRGNMGTGVVVIWCMRLGECDHSRAHWYRGKRHTDAVRQLAVTTAPVCCKFKRIRGPAIKSMTSVLHHMTPCNKRKLCLHLMQLAVCDTVALKCLSPIIRLMWISWRLQS